MIYIRKQMDQEIVDKIKAKLEQTAIINHITIPIAIESGSRAWGFPSPDSDYDCRFVFIRRYEDYLNLWPLRDVVELPLDKIYDINGWDLSKAIKLLANGNAVIVEWLNSPIFYTLNHDFRNGFLELASNIAPRNKIIRHYFHLSMSNFKNHIANLEEISQKKMLYSLRPAMALKWMRIHENENIAPMNLQSLMKGADLKIDLKEEIEEVLRQKIISKEKGKCKPNPKIISFIEEELQFAGSCEPDNSPISEDQQDLANSFFKNSIEKYGS